jgi:putative DNA primase/helicase
LKFLQEVLPDEDVRKFLATLMGVSLIGTQIEHMLVIFYGNGRNGKGVTEEVMRYTLGDYGVPAASDLFTAKPGAHTTSQTDLLGSRLAIIDETESNAPLNEALVKNMTGGGTHVARRMNKNNIRFHKTWLAVMITNHLPTIVGDSIAIWDRLVLVVFPRFFELNERNKNLREELKEEADGIFRWAYEAWKVYQDNEYRLPAYPESITKALQEYRHDHDKVQKWIDERCQLGFGDLFITKSVELQKDYHDWQRTETGAEPLNDRGFVAAMKHKNFQYNRSRSTFTGIRLDPGREKSRVRSGEE